MQSGAFSPILKKIHLQTTEKLRLTEVKTRCVINANWRKLQLFRYNNQKLLMIMEVHLDKGSFCLLGHSIVLSLYGLRKVRKHGLFSVFMGFKTHCLTTVLLRFKSYSGNIFLIVKKCSNR